MRLRSVLVLIPFLIATACSKDETSLPDVQTLFPANNEVGSWVENTIDGHKYCRAGVQVATTQEDIVALINGGFDPFLGRDYNAFAIECYTDGTYELELSIWQFINPSVANELYDALLTEDHTHETSTWETATLGDKSRIANTTATWWFDVTEGAHLLEVNIGEGGNTPDATSKAAAETFIKAVLAKL